MGCLTPIIVAIIMGMVTNISFAQIAWKILENNNKDKIIIMHWMNMASQ